MSERDVQKEIAELVNPLNHIQYLPNHFLVPFGASIQELHEEAEQFVLEHLGEGRIPSPSVIEQHLQQRGMTDVAYWTERRLGCGLPVLVPKHEGDLGGFRDTSSFQAKDLRELARKIERRGFLRRWKSCPEIGDLKKAIRSGSRVLSLQHEAPPKRTDYTFRIHPIHDRGGVNRLEIEADRSFLFSPTAMHEQYEVRLDYEGDNPVSFFSYSYSTGRIEVRDGENHFLQEQQLALNFARTAKGTYDPSLTFIFHNKQSGTTSLFSVKDGNLDYSNKTRRPLHREVGFDAQVECREMSDRLSYLEQTADRIDIPETLKASVNNTLCLPLVHTSSKYPINLIATRD